MTELCWTATMTAFYCSISIHCVYGVRGQYSLRASRHPNPSSITLEVVKHRPIAVYNCNIPSLVLETGPREEDYVIAVNMDLFRLRRTDIVFSTALASPSECSSGLKAILHASNLYYHHRSHRHRTMHSGRRLSVVPCCANDEGPDGDNSECIAVWCAHRLRVRERPFLALEAGCHAKNKVCLDGARGAWS